jgi:hypothetical protein
MALGSKIIDLFILIKDPHVVFAQNIHNIIHCMRKIEGSYKFFPFFVLNHLFQWKTQLNVLNKHKNENVKQ